MQRFARFALALTLALLPALAWADVSAKPNAYTENDRLREKLEYLHKTLVDAYKDIGNKNPAWDAEAIKFLESSAKHFGSSGFGSLHQIDAPQWPQLIEQGEAAVKKGCDDPLVLYCYSAFLLDSGRADDGKPVLQQSYKALLNSKYPAERTYFAASRLHKLAESAKDRLELSTELDKARMKMISGKFVNSAHRRAIADWLWEEFPATPSKRQAFYEQANKNPDTDKWIVNLFGGRHFIQAAWAARGSGWGNQVKAEGWRGFEGNLEKARECLSVAWKLAPNLPEAPAEMITVAMGQGGRGQNELRTWFDRAIDAQFDYMDAYHKLTYSLMPRWLGSHEEMLAVGIECYRTGRYDTWVPYHLIRTLESIRDDSRGDMSLWDKPEMYDMIKDLMLNYAAQFKGKSDNDYRWYISYAAALANRNNRHDESRKLLEQIADKIHQGPYLELRLNPRLSVSESYLLTGPFADRFSRALELQKAQKHQQAAADLQKLVDELPKDDKSSPIAREHLQRSHDALKLAAGEWVDLSPRLDMEPWSPGPGSWSNPKQGELMGVAGESGLMTLAGLDMPSRYEFSAEFEIRKMADIQYPHAGMVLNFTGWQNGAPGVWLYPNDKKLLLRGKEDKWAEVDCTDRFKLDVRVMDDQATVLLDGKEVGKLSGISRANAKHMGIGLSGMFNCPQGTVVVREMRVRKIQKEEAR